MVVVQVDDDSLAVQIGRGRGGVWQVVLLRSLDHVGQLVLKMAVADLHVALFEDLQLCVQAPELLLENNGDLYVGE